MVVLSAREREREEGGLVAVRLCFTSPFSLFFWIWCAEPSTIDGTFQRNCLCAFSSSSSGVLSCEFYCSGLHFSLALVLL